MALLESDIIDFFQAAARWSALRSATIDVAVDGGAALVLQTHFRRAASDLDLRFKAVFEAGGRKMSSKERRQFFMRFYRAHKNAYPLDLAYAEFMERRINFDASTYDPPTRHYASYLDARGLGARVHLADLDHIRKTKDILALSDADPLHASSLIDRQDRYGLSILRQEETAREASETLPSSKTTAFRDDEIERLARMGRKRWPLPGLALEAR